METVDDDLGRAGVGVGAVVRRSVVSELLPELTEVFGQLPDLRRRMVIRAAEQIARIGWLEKRPGGGDTTDAELDALNRSRAQAQQTKPEDSSGTSGQTTLPSLLSVARSERWLKVDTAAAYR